jgi:hypothetical protein
MHQTAEQKEGTVTYNISRAEPNKHKRPTIKMKSSSRRRLMRWRHPFYTTGIKKQKKGPYSLYSALQVMYRAYICAIVLEINLTENLLKS